MDASEKFIATAAWNIPKNALESFPSTGSHLERYSQILNGVEINSCFYKDHQAKSYKRWASSTPPGFRFSLKLHQRFTHEKDAALDTKDLLHVLEGMGELAEKWDVLLLQFPGSLSFQKKRVELLYKTIRKVFSGSLVIEPRNQTWITENSVELLQKYRISKVLADPEKCEASDTEELDYGGLTYHRLHGSPLIYKSAYTQDFLLSLAKKMKSQQKVWCVFDNTTFGKATENALELKKILGVDYGSASLS